MNMIELLTIEDVTEEERNMTSGCYPLDTDGCYPDDCGPVNGCGPYCRPW